MFGTVGSDENTTCVSGTCWNATLAEWEPRLSEKGALCAVIIPSVFCGVWYLIAIITMCAKSYDIHEKYTELHDKGLIYEQHWIEQLWFGIKRFYLPPILLIIDAADVVFDCMYFTQLEMTEDQLSFHVTRNSRVNNAILAFACTGALKAPLYVLIHRNSLEHLQI